MRVRPIARAIRNVALSCALLPFAARPQTPAPGAPVIPAVSEAEAHEHLQRRVEPTYPDAAQAAQVAGTVTLRVTIDQGGHVAHIVPVSGPVLLVPAASEAVRQWKYAPFTVQNAPAEVHTTVRVPFGELAAQAEQQRLLAEYRPLWKDCAAAVSTGTDVAKQLAACRFAAGEAAQFTPGTRPGERRQADEYYAVALARTGKLPEAATWAGKALPLFAQDPADPAGANTAYLLMAQAGAAGGDVAASARDLTLAENGLRKALRGAPNPDLKRRYADALKKSLEFHAKLLTLMRNPSDAEAKLHEADAL